LEFGFLCCSNGKKNILTCSLTRILKGECHKQLRMSTEIFMDLHDLLVSRYGLQPSMHMNTYEAFVIFLFICAGQPGSMHDTSVLYNAMRVDEMFFPHPPKGNVIE
jgi:hypothetical protein